MFCWKTSEITNRRDDQGAEGNDPCFSVCHGGRSHPVLPGNSPRPLGLGLSLHSFIEYCLCVIAICNSLHPRGR